MKINFGKLLIGAIKIVGPGIALAVATKTPVGKAVVGSLKDAARKELAKP